jgi:hypothetical protein
MISKIQNILEFLLQYAVQLYVGDNMEKNVGLKNSRQVNVTIDGEVKRMFEWLRTYDKSMASDSKTAMYLMKLGVEALKEKDAKEIEPLEEGVFNSLVESGNSSIRNL